MTGSPALHQPFFGALKAAIRSKILDPSSLEPSLQRVVQAAVQQWPTFEVSTHRFMTHLAERIDPGRDLVEALRRLHAADLYLAFACSERCQPAIEAFEAEFFPVVTSALSRLRLSAAIVDDIRQTLREQLLVAYSASRPPMVLSFSGRGPLRSWLRIIAVRTSGKVLERVDREIPLGEQVLHGLLTPSEDAELQHLKRIYRADFKDAFKQALRSLTSRQRNLLRHQYQDQLSIDKIGAIYRVDRSTAARWLTKVRQMLLARTGEALMHRLSVGQGELDSIMRLIGSQLDITLRSFFARDD
jgi:RNA polymerase sigma-70 factor, ECF subfamily